MPVDDRCIRMRDIVTFHIAVCDVNIVWQITHRVLENIAVRSQVHLESCTGLHTILDDRHWTQSIATTLSIQLGVVISSLDIDCGLPRQQNLVVMIHPSAGHISIPILDVELCVCHAHCIQITLHRFQTTFVGRVG